MLALCALLLPTDMEPYNGILACDMVRPVCATLPLVNNTIDSLSLGCDMLNKTGVDTNKNFKAAVQGEQLSFPQDPGGL